MEVPLSSAHAFAESSADLKKYSKLTYTDAAEGMLFAILFVSIYAQPFIYIVRGLHLTRALPAYL